MTAATKILRSPFTRSLARAGLSLLVAAAFTTPAAATVVTDAAGDYLPTFTGTKAGELDVLSAFFTFDGSFFHVGATLNGTVGSLPTSLFVFGFNRGAGTAGFPTIAPGVLFDSVVTLTGAGVLGGRDIAGNVNLPLAGFQFRIVGSTIAIDIPLAALPTKGFAPSAYQVNLWPRDSSQAGNAAIADFAPDNADFTVSLVPEPGSIALLFAGVAGMVAMSRRRPASGGPFAPGLAFNP